jgi:hypothetical protein
MMGRPGTSVEKAAERPPKPAAGAIIEAATGGN